MALTKSFETEYGITHANAYARVIDVELNYIDETAKIKVFIYHNQDARNNDKRPIEVRNHEVFNIDLNGEEVDYFDTYFAVDVLDNEDTNAVSKAYEYIKTLDEWDGWNDV